MKTNENSSSGLCNNNSNNMKANEEEMKSTNDRSDKRAIKTNSSSSDCSSSSSGMGSGFTQYSSSNEQIEMSKLSKAKTQLKIIPIQSISQKPSILTPEAEAVKLGKTNQRKPAKTQTFKPKVEFYQSDGYNDEENCLEEGQDMEEFDSYDQNGNNSEHENETEAENEDEDDEENYFSRDNYEIEPVQNRFGPQMAKKRVGLKKNFKKRKLSTNSVCSSQVSPNFNEPNFLLRTINELLTSQLSLSRKMDHIIDTSRDNFFIVNRRLKGKLF